MRRQRNNFKTYHYRRTPCPDVIFLIGNARFCACRVPRPGAALGRPATLRIMSVDQRMVIDTISTTPEGRCVLTIFDHLPWEDDKHLLMLQDKINDYLGYIQSGQLFQSRPDARNRELEIRVVCKFNPQRDIAVRFLEVARRKLQEAKIRFSYLELPTSSK